MYILGYKSEDENGYEYIDNIIGIYSKEKYANEEIESQIKQHKLLQKKRNLKNKEESLKIKEFVVENYEKIILAGYSKYATLRSGDKDSIIAHLVNNPGFVREVLKNNNCPLYSGKYGYDYSRLDKDYFIIKEVELVK